MNRIRLWSVASLLTIGAIGLSAAWADGNRVVPLETFDASAEARWDYVADGVMGGVSLGGAEINPSEGGFVRLTGDVSTDNNGGFIQVRQRFDSGWPETAEGLRLRVRGNGEAYYIFLRTTDAQRPWHSYRAEFQTSSEWQEVRLPFSSFAPSRNSLPEGFSPADVRSIGIVAYGRDHQADISVAEIDLY